MTEKILFQHELFGHVGILPHPEAMRAIALLGTEVAPVVREEVVRRRATADAA